MTQPFPQTLPFNHGYCHEESSLIAPTQYRTALQEFLTKIREVGVSAPQGSEVR